MRKTVVAVGGAVLLLFSLAVVAASQVQTTTVTKVQTVQNPDGTYTIVEYPVGKETLARSYGVVKKGGIVMSLVARPDPAELQKHGIRGTGISSHADAEDLKEVAQLIDAGKIKPIVTQVLPVTDAVKAQQQAATHHTRGKVVLRIADEPKS